MSQVRVSGNASGTGIITVTSPNTNTNYTLTLPANTGTLVTNATAGTVLQIVQMTSSTAVSNSTATFISTGLTQAITPSSTSSKILITAYCPIRMGSSNGIYGGIRINRNSGTILMTDTMANNVAAITDISYPITLVYLDSPATTSSTTYTIEFNTTGAASPYAYPTVNYAGNPHLSTLTLMEIAG